LIPVTSVGEKTVILAASLDRDRDALDQALKGAFFEIMELPREAMGTIEEALTSLRSQIADLQDSLAGLQAQCDRLKEELGPELGRLRNRIDLTRTLLKARVLFGKVDHAYLISGWIPAGLVDKLKEDLAAELGDRALVEVLSPETVPGIREGTLKIPILFNNPFLIRPFERLTRAYGTPGYGEVEPTAFLAMGFLTMFGLMFGDLGQGAVLVGLGYLILRRFLRYTDYGIILMECGVSSMVFGLLYGSFFGIEGLLPVLWFSPLQNINYFMKISLLLGVGFISLGLILSFINAVRLKKGRLPAAKLLAALFYWILAALGLRYLITGALVWDYWVSVVVGVVSLVLIGLFIVQRLRAEPEKARPQGEGLAMQLLEGAIEVVDGTVRYVANTISFIRIAAFALAHAGLFIAVFSLAETLGRMQGGGILYWLTVVLGNVVIILLEGLVVSIQTVRLEYYEFLSKFFRGVASSSSPWKEKPYHPKGACDEATLWNAWDSDDFSVPALPVPLGEGRRGCTGDRFQPGGHEMGLSLCRHCCGPKLHRCRGGRSRGGGLGFGGHERETGISWTSPHFSGFGRRHRHLRPYRGHYDPGPCLKNHFSYL
jgi:V/A-type H+-transporting ATPase subunit I